MNTMSSMNIARSYASHLYTLSNEVKKDMAKLLIDSITMPEVQPTETVEDKLDRLYGCWANDPNMENIDKEIRNARSDGKTRKIISLD